MTASLDDVSLPASLAWSDRDDWQPVAQSARQTLDGGLAIFYQPLTAGRPITLVSTDSSGWVERQTLDALQALASVPGSLHTLTLGEQSFTVLWRHEDPPAIAAEPLVARLNPAPGDWFRVTLKFTAL